jgi:ribosome-binding protein aMBF1 (putative translation factor)
MTNAERQAAWRTRREQEAKEARAKDPPPPAVAPEPPPPLKPGTTKARTNQYVERDASGRLSRKLPTRRWVPDAERAKNAFGARMKEARLAAGLSQAEVAYALFGSGQKYVKRYINWEIGRSPMAIEVIEVFADVVGTDCNFLFSMRR